MAMHTIYGWRTVNDVTVEAGVHRNVYERAVRVGVIARPTHKLRGGRRTYYTADEAAAVVAQLRLVARRRDIPSA